MSFFPWFARSCPFATHSISSSGALRLISIHESAPRAVAELVSLRHAFSQEFLFSGDLEKVRVSGLRLFFLVDEYVPKHPNS